MNVSRASLDLANKALNRFAFLTTDYDFVLRSVDITLVQFESTNVFVNDFHARNSYEVGAEVGLLMDRGERGRAYDISFLVQLGGSEAYATYRAFSAYEPEVLDRALSYLAEAMRTYGSEALRGDPGVFDRLKRQEEQNIKVFGNHMHALQARSAAQEAWQRHDYTNVAYHYGQIRDDLTPAKKKKYNYAVGKLATGEHR